MTERRADEPERPRPRSRDASGLEGTMLGLVSSARGATGSLPNWARRMLYLAGIDLAPIDVNMSMGALAIATCVALAGSLGVDAVIVRISTFLIPSTVGYSHFAFADYAKLTAIGVLGACAAWPVIRYVSSTPRKVFLRAAVATTVILLAPDVYIWALGQPGRAVAVLVVMHLAIAAITYNALVRLCR